MSDTHYVTAEGLEKLKAELAEAISQRPVISRQIAEARDKGDLSENAEYDAAKEAQGLLELKISKLENLVANARVIDESKINTDHVQMLTKVTLKNLLNNTTVQYTLVGESEANFREGKLAAGTPIGKALIGKRKGDVVEVKVPSGILKFEILDINSKGGDTLLQGRRDRELLCISGHQSPEGGTYPGYSEEGGGLPLRSGRADLRGVAAFRP